MCVCVCVKEKYIFKERKFLRTALYFFFVDLQNIHYVDHFCPVTDHQYQEVSNQITGNIIGEYVQYTFVTVCVIYSMIQ